MTGEALASSNVVNGVNTTETYVHNCGCANLNGNNTVTVSNMNTANVVNTVKTKAKTGYNTANGGSVGNTVSGGSSWFWWNQNNNSNNGGNAANGSNGGAITTGPAAALSTTGNVVNSTITVVGPAI